MQGLPTRKELLACPVCLSGQQKPRYSVDGLRYHLTWFHKRTDVRELIELAKKLRKEGI